MRTWAGAGVGAGAGTAAGTWAGAGVGLVDEPRLAPGQVLMTTSAQIVCSYFRNKSINPTWSSRRKTKILLN